METLERRIQDQNEQLATLREQLAKSERLATILGSAVFELAEDTGHGEDVIDQREQYLIQAGHIAA